MSESLIFDAARTPIGQYDSVLIDFRTNDPE